MKTFLAVLALGLSTTSFGGYHSCRGSVGGISACLDKDINVTIYTDGPLLYTFNASYRFVPGAQFCDGPTRRPGHYADGRMSYTIGGFDFDKVGGPYQQVTVEMDGDVPKALIYRLSGLGQTRTRVSLNCHIQGEDA